LKLVLREGVETHKTHNSISIKAHEDWGDRAFLSLYCSSYETQPKPDPLDDAKRIVCIHLSSSWPWLGHFCNNTSIKTMKAEVQTCMFVIRLCLCCMTEIWPPLICKLFTVFAYRGHKVCVFDRWWGHVVYLLVVSSLVEIILKDYFVT
jgi:hypothetical protein